MNVESRLQIALLVSVPIGIGPALGDRTLFLYRVSGTRL